MQRDSLRFNPMRLIDLDTVIHKNESHRIKMQRDLVARRCNS